MRHHLPKLYRYRVAPTQPRAMWNRYPGSLIGAAIIVGKHAYCVKWAKPR